MSAQPVSEHDPDDPDEILRALPEIYRETFLREYYAGAAEAARTVDGYRQLRELLRLWRLRSVAYSSHGFEERQARVAEALSAGDVSGFVPAEEVFGAAWTDRS
ncbi:MAG TPA: DUF6247 family protein [Streptosporangiaceae bacterium]|nr:DUF6247 family protein [Streptosporangiaceae bacterium]